MNRTILLIVLASLIFTSCSNGQNTTIPILLQNRKMDDFEFSLNTAHSNAKALMKDDFFWSPIEESAPFGNDDGFDAAYGFRKWRIFNKTVSPMSFLKDMIASWNYPYFDYNEMDTVKIRTYINSKVNLDENAIREQMQSLKEAFKNSSDSSMGNMDDNQLRELIDLTSKEMGGSFLLGQDNAIIGIGFAQFVLEGRIDHDIKAVTITALNRQLIPLLINRYEENYRNIRIQQLTKMRDVIKKANS